MGYEWGVFGDLAFWKVWTKFIFEMKDAQEMDDVSGIRHPAKLSIHFNVTVWNNASRDWKSANVRPLVQGWFKDDDVDV